MKNKEAGSLRGFTLIELLVGIAIAAVLATIAVPSMAALVKRNRLAAAHNDFLSSLYLVRSEAAKRNRIVKMCRGPGTLPATCDTSAGGGWHTGWAIWVDGDSDNQIDAAEQVVSIHNGVAKQVRLTGNASVANRIAFRAAGGTSGVTNGTFTVCVPGGSTKRQIIVSRPGRIRMAEVASDGSC